MSFLPYNDLIEASAAYKFVYHLSRMNVGYFEKLSHSRVLFRQDILCCYEEACVLFAVKLSGVIDQYLEDEPFFEIKRMVLDRLFFTFLPFRVWNQLFLCSRSYYCSNMCLICTRLVINHRSTSDYMNEKLFVQVTDLHPSLRKGIGRMDKIYLYIHYLIPFIGEKSRGGK